MNIVITKGNGVNYSLIPLSMRDTLQWVVWKYRNREGKPTKVPYNPRTDRAAQSNDPTTWGTLKEAIKANQRVVYSGIGFMFDSGFAGLDLDQCRNPNTGEIEDWAMEIVAELESYTEVSPSGTGLHVFIKGKLPGTGLNKRNWKGHKIEIYDTGRFFTFTGNHLEGTPLEVNECQDEIESLYNRVVQSTVGKARAHLKRNAATLRDNEVIELALNARNGAKFAQLWDGDTSNHPSPSEADFAFVKILCFWTQDDEQIARLWKESNLNREKLDREDYIESTIANARSQQTKSYTPRSTAKHKCVDHSEVTGSDSEGYGPPISKDRKREDYLRTLLANSSRMTRARMMMVAVLGFEKVTWRLLNAIHAFQRNKLGVRIITDKDLQKVYRGTGERGSERTIRRDKKKLWEEQERIGIELVGYWHGRQNAKTGKNYGSRYTSHIDRWALMAVDLAITNNGNKYSFRDDQLKAACEEMATRIMRRPKKKKTSKGEMDMVPEILTIEKKMQRVGKQYNKLKEQLRSAMTDAGYTGGEIYHRVEEITAALKMPTEGSTQVN